MGRLEGSKPTPSPTASPTPSPSPTPTSDSHADPDADTDPHADSDADAHPDPDSDSNPDADTDAHPQSAVTQRRRRSHSARPQRCRADRSPQLSGSPQRLQRDSLADWSASSDGPRASRPAASVGFVPPSGFTATVGTVSDRTSTNSSFRTDVPPRSSTARPRSAAARCGRAGPFGRAGRLPAGPDLAAEKRLALPVETAVSELSSHRPAEVPAGRAGRRGPMADPTSRRLRLGCRAVGATPHGHRSDGSLRAASMSNGRSDRKARASPYDSSPLTTPSARHAVDAGEARHTRPRGGLSRSRKSRASVIAVPLRIVSSIPESGQLVHGSRAQQ